MTGTHEITSDRTRGLFVITLRGFFSLDDLPALARDRDDGLRALGMAPHTHVTLCDVSECKIQAQDVVAAFGRLLNDSDASARRLAIVTGASAARMQVRRLIDRPSLAFFDTRAEAEAWLFEERAAA